MGFSDDGKEKIILSLEKSDEFTDDIQKYITIKSLERFMDMYHWDKHYEINITMEEFEKYFQPIVEKYKPKMVEYSRKKILEGETDESKRFDI